jgi:predicted metal-dependent hydrolase
MSPFGRAFADGDRLELAGAVVRLKVHRGARRVSLRVDRTRREVVATAPSARKLVDAVAFAKSRAAWIAERLAEIPDGEPITPGLTLEVFGQPCRLEPGTGRARWIEAQGEEPARIVAMGEGEGYARAVTRILKQRALLVLTDRTAAYCEGLGVPPPQITVADAKGRWGSCRPPHRGKPAAIRYSWRLALAPFATADYVVAHECAHLVELNHSPQFWAVVRRIFGDERPHRAWLRAHGVRLHAFGAR